jgi:hypothetical protein
VPIDQEHTRAVAPVDGLLGEVHDVLEGRLNRGFVEQGSREVGELERGTHRTAGSGQSFH